MHSDDGSVGGSMMGAFIALAVYLQLARAQDLSVPSTWRDPSTTLTSSTRVTIAQDCVDTLTAQLDTSTGSFTG
ncbi:hypothetical protein BJ138DRAFT_677431 [Hygrophoropsis aurantiaca]|uniref:Uncharacterized protein n=1 Tax=Hygrophoropsis aurantiaca TaxID=72124 RepID=A0ACB8AKK8_9AGAM|nr:hypothetical protein BJ138DRAFT_677431 [Hygrophoropsis aurantiaca]